LEQKQAAMLAVCAILLFCVAAAGCTSSTSSSSNATNVSTTTTSAQASTSASIVTPSASASATSAKLTVLFFYSPTCPYCQALESTSSYHQLENTSKITFTPIVSATSPLTDQYNVTTIPTLILLNHGTEVGRWVDATDATGINAQIASLLNPS
jgi:thioredoxin-like negative regulator of GroEL